jgi:hypothetical protein
MHSRPRIGVLTFHRCINYGSYWQARSLVEALRQRGRDAVLLDYHSPRSDRAEWRCALQPVLPTLVPRKDRLLYRLKMLKFFHAFSTLPASQRFPLDEPDRMEEFECVVVGSDEVWNLHHPWFGQCPLFYGTGLRTRRRVSYAASFGNYHASEGLHPYRADQLRSFDALSVRDENSRALIQAALSWTPDLVVDPCLLAPSRQKRIPGASKRPYLAVYGHNFSQRFSTQVRRWARSRGLPLVSIGYRNDWADRQWLSAGPHEFARFIAGAQAVATNFFHGCVFSLRHRKPFVCELTPYRSIKVENLMAQFGGLRHLASEDAAPEQYDACLEEPLDAAMLARIEALRGTSAAFLDRAVPVERTLLASSERVAA